MRKILSTLFNHERYQSLSIIAASLLLLVLWGCPGKAPSLLNPTKRVTKAELQNELELMLIRAEQGFTSIEQQEKIKHFIFQQSILAGTTGSINPFALLTSLGSIMGVGAGIDNVRKRKEIKSLTKWQNHSA